MNAKLATWPRPDRGEPRQYIKSGGLNILLNLVLPVHVLRTAIVKRRPIECRLTYYLGNQNRKLKSHNFIISRKINHSANFGWVFRKWGDGISGAWIHRIWAGVLHAELNLPFWCMVPVFPVLDWRVRGNSAWYRRYFLPLYRHQDQIRC